MKNVIICTMLASIICLSYDLAAQDLTPKKDEVTGKWGFVDKQGKVVISYQYEIAGKFCEGLAAIAIDNKAGYINTDGKIVIPLRFDGVASFEKNGFAVVIIDSKRGLIDKTGKEIIPCQVSKDRFF